MYMKKAKVTVFDNRKIDEIPKNVMDQITTYNFEFVFGDKCLEKLKGFDIIFRSPSLLPTKEELINEANRGAIITTEIEMLMKMAPCKIIGITGSDGKTTTTTLISEMLKKAGYRVFLGGNIGMPLFTKLADIKANDILVLELSSFQLMGMDVSPDISLITNITPNHLNIHKNLDEYINSKKNIFLHQDEKGILVLNYDNTVTKNLSKEAKRKSYIF